MTAPPRETTDDRCEHGCVPSSSCYDLRCLRAQLAAETEARRKAVEVAKHGGWLLTEGLRHLDAAEAERDAARAELEATRRTLTATIAAHEETMRERDQARGEVADLLAHADADAHYATRAARAESALATAERERDGARRELTRRMEERRKLRAVIERVIGIAEESDGISGWHLNGAVMPWNEQGLLDELRAALAAPRPEHGEAIPDWNRCDVCGVRPSAIGGYCADCDVLTHAVETKSTDEIVEFLEQRKKANPHRVAAPPPRDPAGETGGGK